MLNYQGTQTTIFQVMTDDIMALDTLIKDKNFENVKVWEFLGGLIQFCCVLSAFNVSETFNRKNIGMT